MSLIPKKRVVALNANAAAALYEGLSRADAVARSRLSEAIVRHIRQYPQVADTADGIVKWWLPRRGYEYAPEHIEAVLKDMVARDWLRIRKMPDGKILYMRGDAPGL